MVPGSEAEALESQTMPIRRPWVIQSGLHDSSHKVQVR